MGENSAKLAKDEKKRHFDWDAKKGGGGATPFSKTEYELIEISFTTFMAKTQSKGLVSFERKWHRFW